MNDSQRLLSDWMQFHSKSSAELKAISLSKIDGARVESGANTDPLDVLVLADGSVKHINTVSDHLNGLIKFSRHAVAEAEFRIFNQSSEDRLPFSFERFDVIVLHYSVIVAGGRHLGPAFRARLKAYKGLKVIFIQDEYRWVDDTAKAIEDCGFHILFSVVNEAVIDKVYHHEGLKDLTKKVTLTGFVPKPLLSRTVPSYRDRPIDVGYRARKVPAWLGEFAHEKWVIGQRFRVAGEAASLVCDIESDEHKRLYGEEWIGFLSNCKAVLGTESGASVCDFDGTIQRKVEAFEAAHPDVDFEHVRNKFFADVDGVLTINVISPRCFEAAALRTLMILYPGTYSGRLEPWKHYVPLERDFSNFDDVLAIIRDPVRATEITDRAYREVACSYENTFEAMVADFDAAIDEKWPSLGFSRATHRPDMTTIQNMAERAEARFRKRGALKRGVHRVVHAVIRICVPVKVQPAVIRMAQSAWRRLTRVG